MQFLCLTSFVTVKLLLTLAYSLKGGFFTILNSMKSLWDPFQTSLCFPPRRAGNVSEPAQCLTNVSQSGRKKGRESTSHRRRVAEKNELAWTPHVQRDRLPGIRFFSAGAHLSCRLAVMQEAAGVLKEGFLVKRVGAAAAPWGLMISKGGNSPWEGTWWSQGSW